VSAPKTIVYTVDCTEPERHIYHVSLQLTGFGPGRHALTMPVWIPWWVQDASRHVFNVRVEHGAAGGTAVEKTAKNTWCFEAAADRVVVTYSVYAFEPRVDASHLDGTHAFWNGGNLFMMVDGEKNLPIDLYIQAPEGWHVSTGLDRVDGHPFQFRAPNYDVLFDCPVEVGTHRRFFFEVGGKRHELALWGTGNEDAEQLVADTRRIVEAEGRMFGGLPYDHYTFILHIGERGGGLEHMNSTACGVRRTAFRPWDHYRHVLELLAHEFFHLWNVKRIHPDTLGPFDYEREVYTHLLWAMEGFTSYYAMLSLRRAGLYTVSEYLGALAHEVETYEKLPGRYVMSLASASFDTWIKLSKPDADSPNRSISYYLKGHLVGVLMDLEIRRRTDNGQSLDDVLRLLYQRYGAAGVGFPEHAYQDAVEEVAGGSLQEFFARYIEGVDELPLDELLATAGLKLERVVKNPDRREGDDGAGKDDSASDPAYAWLGVECRADRPGIEVCTVYDPGPGAGSLYAGDEILAVNRVRVKTPDEVAARVRADAVPGSTVSVQLFREGLLLDVPVTVGEAPPNRYRLVRLPDASPRQRATYESWLAASWPESEGTAAPH
jgi:predicted metalloprotease with PDZ domain